MLRIRILLDKLLLKTSQQTNSILSKKGAGIRETLKLFEIIKAEPPPVWFRSERKIE